MGYCVGSQRSPDGAWLPRICVAGFGLSINQQLLQHCLSPQVLPTPAEEGVRTSVTYPKGLNAAGCVGRFAASAAQLRAALAELRVANPWAQPCSPRLHSWVGKLARQDGMLSSCEKPSVST